MDGSVRIENDTGLKIGIDVKGSVHAQVEDPPRIGSLHALGQLSGVGGLIYRLVVLDAKLGFLGVLDPEVGGLPQTRVICETGVVALHERGLEIARGPDEYLHLKRVVELVDPATLLDLRDRFLGPLP